MRDLGHHLVLKLQGRRLLAPTTALRRELARIVVALGRPRGLIAFGAPDNHMHIVTVADRATAGELARVIGYSVQRRLRPGAPFERSWIEGLSHQGHLHNTVRYALGQHVRHQVREDPIREASLLPDLLGLRVLATDLVRRLQEALPRLSEHELLEAAGWMGLDLGGWVEQADELADAAASAAALTNLGVRVPGARSARRAALAVGLELIGPSAGSALGLSKRAVRNLRRLPGDPDLEAAIKRQLALRAQLRPAGWMVAPAATADHRL